MKFEEDTTELDRFLYEKFGAGFSSCCSNTEEVFKYVWSIENDIGKHLNNTPSKSKIEKSNNISEKCRKEGNDEFRRRNFRKALELYVKSIMFAENSQESAENGNALSLGYANCSATLFELKLFDESVFSIQKAIDLRYPDLLKPKLIQRLAKCYVSLDKAKEAQATLVHYLEEFKYMDEQQKKVLEASKVKVQNLLSECQKGGIVTEKPVTSRTLNKDCQEISIVDPHPDIPSAICASSLKYCESKGRYMCATRDIEPGE